MSLYPNKQELIASLFRYSMMAHGYIGTSSIDIARLQRDWRNFPLIVQMLKELPNEPSAPDKVDHIIRWILESIRTLQY